MLCKRDMAVKLIILFLFTFKLTNTFCETQAWTQSEFGMSDNATFMKEKYHKEYWVCSHSQIESTDEEVNRNTDKRFNSVS